ncbi:MAG: hypothetical protein ACI8UP_003751 [Porticoccaceae bacterium]|jgi:hypothetical protein
MSWTLRGNMKLVLGALQDFNTAGQLACQLIVLGCVADQFIFLSQGVPLLDSNKNDEPCLCQIYQEGENVIWAIREPEYYSCGIRDNRMIKWNSRERIKRFEQYQLDKPLTSDGSIFSSQHPLALLHLHNRSEESLAQIKCVVRCSQDRVQIIDYPNW